MESNSAHTILVVDTSQPRGVELQEGTLFGLGFGLFPFEQIRDKGDKHTDKIQPRQRETNLREVDASTEEGWSE